MTMVSSTLNQLSPTLASSFVPLLTFASTFFAALQVIGLCAFSIFGLTLIVAEIRRPVLELGFLKGKSGDLIVFTSAKNRYFLFPRMDQARASVFPTLQLFAHIFGGFRKHAP
jgi:hypothetical protein